MKLQIFLLCSLFTAMSFFCGCKASLSKEPLPEITFKDDRQILENLQRRFTETVPLKANGQCTLLYYIKGKPHKENFPVQIWVNPPSEIYMQGDIAFSATGIVLGSNQDEFWFALSPKEISSYWWGDWSQQSSLGTMMINPHVMLESMGAVKIEDIEKWRFADEDSCRVLIKQDGEKVKRIFVSSRDGAVRRIEYIGFEGEASTVTELGRYIKVAEDFYVPSEIKIVRRLASSKGSFVSFRLKISSVRQVSFTQEQKQFLFQRQPVQGFKHIYRIIDGRIIEQQQ